MTRERDQNPGSWSADGKIALVEVHPETGHDIWILDEGSSRRIEPFLTTRAEERYPTFSPDGRWLAYTSNESGREEVYVQRYPAQGRRVLVSASGGHSPAWSTTELFYVTHTPGISVMNAVPFTTAGSELSVGTPRRLFEGRYGITAPGRGYDVAPDGRRFLMVRSDEPPAREVFDLVMVQNWFDELKARVPVR